MAKRTTTKKTKQISTETSETIAETKAPKTETSTVEAKKKVVSDKTTNREHKNYLLTAAVAVLFVICGITMVKCHRTDARIETLEQSLKDMESNFSQNVEDTRKIYVFNMDETVKAIGLQDANQKFEADINDLDTQVKEAQATVKGLKDEEMKSKILNLSIKPLQMKRDDLLAAYTKSMQDVLLQINEALAEIAQENNVPTVFMSKSVAVNTNYVVDVTPQVVEKVKAKKGK